MDFCQQCKGDGEIKDHSVKENIILLIRFCFRLQGLGVLSDIPESNVQLNLTLCKLELCMNSTGFISTTEERFDHTDFMTNKSASFSL